MSGPDANDFHWLLTIIQSIDVGVVVLDRDFRVEVWNSFMENRSGVEYSDACQQNFFALFPEVDEAWFRRKVESVATLGVPGFTNWEQRPFLLRFENYQPITGQEAFMYQNTTLLPLRGIDGVVRQICLVIYDVTDVAINRRQLQAANTQLRELSRTDALSGLYNRGYWEESLRQTCLRHHRYGGTSSLVLLDIDHFKRINDSYGHPSGDEVIRRLAALIREEVRECDLVARYGGEEFAVLLPDTDSQGALDFAERLRQAAERLSVEHLGQSIVFTISLGVAEFDAGDLQSTALVERADQALYRSKQTGRNRVTRFL